jgi:hypothetical protein
MSDVRVFSDGGYRYVKAVFQYSAGVAAQPGFEIERARFAAPLPLAEGFAAIKAHLQSLGRPLAAFCACELRSPAPFTEQGFLELNRAYARVLEEWGIYRDGENPVARSNVCPVIAPPAEVSFYAFSYTVPAKPKRRDTFVIAGGAECPEGMPNYRDYIVARGDLSTAGLREKVRFVVAEMQRRMTPLGARWNDALAAHAYTVHDVGSLLEAEILRPGPGASGVTWQFCRPPVVDLEYEMDARSVARELAL